MNIIKFVSVALWSMCMLFLSCKKENPSLNETPATVEIFVCNSKGKPLTSVTLSNNMQRIGYQAFSDCEQLTKVAYVGEMKTADCMVEIGAFQNCTSLTSFAFPQSLSEVQGWTFVGCRKLKEIILPKSVKKVGDQSLRTNSTVETITFEGEEVPELTGNPFPFKESILKIMVPSGKLEAYKAKWDSYESYHSKIEEKS